MLKKVDYKKIYQAQPVKRKKLLQENVSIIISEKENNQTFLYNTLTGQTNQCEMQFVFYSSRNKRSPKGIWHVNFLFYNLYYHRKKTKPKPQAGVTSVAVHYSMDMCDRKVSAWTGIYTNAFTALRLFQCYLTFQMVSLKIYFISSIFHVSSSYHEIC